MRGLADYGRSLTQSNPYIVAETFSHRHAGVTHSLGLSCHPVGTDSFDPRTVALILTIIATKEPTLKGYVAWQSPSFYYEGETATYYSFGEEELADFNEELQRLLGILAAAVERGAPPTGADKGFQAVRPAHHHPMRSTGGAGILSRIRKWFFIVILLLSLGCHSMPRIEQPSAATVSTFLMFQEGNAQEAISLYESVFPGLRIENIERYGPGEPGPEGTIKVARVDLNGHRLMFSDSFVKHAFTFTPSVSLFVDFATADELDAAFATLAAGGTVLMPLDNYGFSRRFGWCSDRFGVSWQLNLPETSSATNPPAK